MYIETIFQKLLCQWLMSGCFWRKTIFLKKYHAVKYSAANTPCGLFLNLYGPTAGKWHAEQLGDVIQCIFLRYALHFFNFSYLSISRNPNSKSKKLRFSLVGWDIDFENCTIEFWHIDYPKGPTLTLTRTLIWVK